MTKAMFTAVMAASLIAASLIAAPLAQTATAQTTQPAAPAKTETKTDDKTMKSPSAGLVAARERQKKCGAEWKDAKAAGKIEKGMKWPKYWSACNKRLKTAG